MGELKKAVVLPLSQERRRHQRVKVILTGRFMREDRREYSCQTVNMSPGGAALATASPPRVGEHVVAYIDHLGRIEGRCARVFDGGFAMTVAATLRRRDKIADQLTWLANRNILGLPEDRRHKRFELRNPRSKLTLPDGSTIECRVIDVSLSGAAVAAKVKLPLGSPVKLGRTPARVVRHLETGFALEFSRLQNPETLEHDVGDA
ncbi:MAG: PilZ domain-containing protein [Bradyrhizobiaceae bacterium]|nr:PilZ domain-containing protein [Bradyrhizobiaceae bacterium]